MAKLISVIMYFIVIMFSLHLGMYIRFKDADKALKEYKNGNNI